MKYQKLLRNNLTFALLALSVMLGVADAEERRSGRDPCSKIQHEIQKSIVHHKWGLDNLKFQQRLKRHPKYIVTIQQVRSLHEPLVELRCPSENIDSTTQKFEFHFHETRFIADSVRLFDIHSIFPIHTGAMSVKLKLDPLIVKMEKIREEHTSINEIYYAAPTADFAKEHREDHDSLLDLEKEIETVFTNRIQPDVQKQLSALISATLKKYFVQNLFKF
ncbi:unnamed protein product [Allacma fusca]|uniref:Uncharacterized protein n=1 Tax=Allacma fusca TaxID=39272 RepID=A0A8J2JEI3_9HEXA|nr:unnamed protein product [Allacma fusca]